MVLNYFKLFVCIFSLLILKAEPATSSFVKRKQMVVDQEGLYSKRDGVTILTRDNIDYYIYGNEKPWFIQFYWNSCGHCRNFMPFFKRFLVSVSRWKNVLNIGVLDCIQEKNAPTCRELNVGTVPHLRYLHENLNISDTTGIQIPRPKGDDQDVEIRKKLVAVMKQEQTQGRFKICPSLRIKSLTTPASILPNAFVIFEHENSTVGAEVILDATRYDERTTIILGLSSSPLAKKLGLYQFPALYFVTTSGSLIKLTPEIANRKNFIKVIDEYVQFQNDIDEEYEEQYSDEYDSKQVETNNDDAVLLDDLEASLKVILFIELSQIPAIEGEGFKALLNFINVLSEFFPFRANGKKFIIDLKRELFRRRWITGEEFQKLLRSLTDKYDPVWVTPAKHVKCKGSKPKYRGATCGIWLMFHTMTIAAARHDDGNSQDVLNALLGYAKYLFGCEYCAQHFQQMAKEFQLTKPKNNKDAVMWLWRAHNVVNLRLSGDPTDDPVYPKRQYPMQERCPQCRRTLSKQEGKKFEWVEDAVYEYLVKIYSNIQTNGMAQSYWMILQYLLRFLLGLVIN